MRVILEGEQLAYATAGSAGADLCYAYGDSFTLYPDERRTVGTGLRLDMSDNPSMCAMVLPRSGSGARGLVLANTIGLIDSDYQGEIMLALLNSGQRPIDIHPGTRIAQIVFLPVHRPLFEFVTEFPVKTDRGEGGFGSTGATPLKQFRSDDTPVSPAKPPVHEQHLQMLDDKLRKLQRLQAEQAHVIREITLIRDKM